MATKDELVERNDQLRKERDNARSRYEKLDPEARAFHLCVKALDELKIKTRSSGGYSLGSGSEYSLGRVVDALRARFNLDQDTSDNLMAQGEWLPDHPEFPPDPRDIVISQMIDALRRG